MAKVIPLPIRPRGQRPMPPRMQADDFQPDAHGLGEWVHRNFIMADGPLHNPRHQHLLDASIGWLWTSAEQTSRDKLVAGQCELVPPMQRKWSSARTHWLFQHWFGTTPDFIITIDATFAESADDWSFCALVDHELCHAAQDVDLFGEPRFDREGRPIFRVIGHDVEQFNDVVQRYGAAAAGVERMAQLANAGPTIGLAQMSAACGTCERRRA